MTRATRSLLTMAAIAGAMVIFIGCGSSREPAPLPPAAELTDPHLLRGRQVFMAHCYQCHPGGAAGLGPALNDKPLPQGMIEFQVRQGLGEMPAFSEEKIPDEELDALAAYVVSLRQRPSPSIQ